MKRSIELVALAALLAGCKPAAPMSNTSAETAEVEPPLDLSWERANCREHIGEISDHPEADARADFAAGKRAGVGFENLGTHTPGGSYSEHCPIGGPGMRQIKGLNGDVATCLDVAGVTYAERYNRELTRLCGVAPAPKPASKH